MPNKRLEYDIPSSLYNLGLDIFDRPTMTPEKLSQHLSRLTETDRTTKSQLLDVFQPYHDFLYQSLSGSHNSPLKRSIRVILNYFRQDYSDRRMGDFITRTKAYIKRELIASTNHFLEQQQFNAKIYPLLIEAVGNGNLYSVFSQYITCHLAESQKQATTKISTAIRNTYPTFLRGHITKGGKAGFDAENISRAFDAILEDVLTTYSAKLSLILLEQQGIAQRTSQFSFKTIVERTFTQSKDILIECLDQAFMRVDR